MVHRRRPPRRSGSPAALVARAAALSTVGAVVSPEHLLLAAPAHLREELSAAVHRVSCAGMPDWNNVRKQVEGRADLRFDETGSGSLGAMLGLSSKKLSKHILDLFTLLERDMVFEDSMGDLHYGCVQMGVVDADQVCFSGLAYAAAVRTIQMTSTTPQSQVHCRRALRAAHQLIRFPCFDLLDYSGWPVKTATLIRHLARMEAEVACMADEEELKAPPSWCDMEEKHPLDRLNIAFLSVCYLFDGRPPTGVECLQRSMWSGAMGAMRDAARAGGGPHVLVAATGTHAPYVFDLLAQWQRFLAPSLAAVIELQNHAWDPTRCTNLGGGCSPHRLFQWMWQEAYHNQTIRRCDGTAVHGFADVASVAAAVESWVLRDPELAKVDIFVCTHPAIGCRVLFPLLERHGRGLIGYIGGALEIGVPEHSLAVWVEDFARAVAHPRAVFVAQNAFLAEKVHYSTGVTLPAVRPVGAHIRWKYTPRRERDVLVWKTSSWCVDNADELLGVLKALTAICADQLGGSAELHLQFQLLRSLVPNNGEGANCAAAASSWPSYADVASFRAVLMFPYDLTVISFYELYHMHIPTFLPGPELATQYVWRGADVLWFNCSSHVAAGHVPWHAVPPGSMWDSPMVLTQWLRFADWYRWPAVQTFESFQELVHGLLTVDLRSVSEEMRLFDEESLVRVANFWGHAFRAVLGIAGADRSTV